MKISDDYDLPRLYLPTDAEEGEEKKNTQRISKDHTDINEEKEEQVLMESISC